MKLEKRVAKLESQVYPSLSPAKRFRLGVQAAANQNEAERERLVNTCPQKLYCMNEAAFTDRVEAAENLAIMFALEIAPRRKTLQLVAAFEQFLHHSLDRFVIQAMWHVERAYENGFWAAGGELPEELSEPRLGEEMERNLSDHQAEHLKSLGKIREAVGAEIKGLWEAFTIVCREEMGLEPEVVLAAFFTPDLDYLEEVEQFLKEGNPVDEKLKSEMLEIMRNGWRERIG